MAVPDRYNFVFFTMVMMGIGSLMPWNMFINANQYFVAYKFTVPDPDENEGLEDIRKNFFIYFGLAAQIPNLLFATINLFSQSGGGSLTRRITGSLIVLMAIFVITIIMAMIDTSKVVRLFFWLTLISAVVMNMACGIFQNSVFGVAAPLPPKYTNCLILGNNISGVITSVMNIIAKVISPGLKTAAIYYFMTALIFLAACLDLYFALPLSRFYRHYVSQYEALRQDDPNELKESKALEADENPKTSDRPPFRDIFLQIWPQCLNVFLVFFVSLAVFPSPMNQVAPVSADGSILTENYFSDVTVFLVFNSFAMLGNIIPSYVQWPGPDHLFIPVICRFALLPLILMCNMRPENRGWAPLIRSDIGFTILNMILALTSGWFSSLAMMYAPQKADPQYAPLAGMMACVFLIGGIVGGLNFAYFLSWILDQKF